MIDSSGGDNLMGNISRRPKTLGVETERIRRPRPFRHHQTRTYRDRQEARRQIKINERRDILERHKRERQERLDEEEFQREERLTVERLPTERLQTSVDHLPLDPDTQLGAFGLSADPPRSRTANPPSRLVAARLVVNRLI